MTVVKNHFCQYTNKPVIAGSVISVIVVSSLSEVFIGKERRTTSLRSDAACIPGPLMFTRFAAAQLNTSVELRRTASARAGYNVVSLRQVKVQLSSHGHYTSVQ